MIVVESVGSYRLTNTRDTVNKVHNLADLLKKKDEWHKNFKTQVEARQLQIRNELNDAKIAM